MRDELLDYYQIELGHLRAMAGAFAEQYPKIAGRLQLDARQSADPHVERLLQGFAFLAARVHLKIDDDFPEITEALLNAVYPHYLRPMPSATIAQFDLDPDKAQLPGGYRIAAGRELVSRLEVKGEDAMSTRCVFRTCYDTTLWPLSVTSAVWAGNASTLGVPARHARAAASLRLRLRCFPDVSFSKLGLSTLRVYLDGPDHVPYTLYELLTNACAGILAFDPARPGTPPVELPANAIQPVGFAANEGVLPNVPRSFTGYRLLQEYFAFPRKFLFVDLGALQTLRTAGFGAEAEICILFSRIDRPSRVDRFEAQIGPNNFRLGCTPAVNLFELVTEPCKLDQRSTGYHLIADDYRLRTTHVFSIDSVALRSGPETVPIEPLYSVRRRGNEGQTSAYWVATRRPSVSRREVAAGGGGPRPGADSTSDAGAGHHGWRATELWLSFIDRTGRVVRPHVDAFDARVTCCNGDLPNRLPIGTGGVGHSDFDMAGGGPFRRIAALTVPSEALAAPAGRSQLWRLVSLLSLNYVSLIDGGVEALRTMLLLHNLSESPTWGGRDHVEGLVGVSSRPHYTRVTGEQGVGFARGRRVEIELDEDKFEGAGAYLFASVLERFLGLYTSINTFSVLVARTRQRREIMREWPPRAGWKSTL